jgi:hypothetical protein
MLGHIMNDIIICNRLKYILISIALVIVTGIIIYSVYAFKLFAFEYFIGIGLVFGMMQLIVFSKIIHPDKHRLIFDGSKFAITENDELIVEGYFVDIEDVEVVKNYNKYPHLFKDRDSDGSESYKMVIIESKLGAIKMKNMKPVMIPTAFCGIIKGKMA